VTVGLPLRVGVLILPEQRWSTARHTWRRAEELGLDHAWTYDHLAWRSLRDSPWFGAVPTLAAAALATQRIRLGPLVASPNFRHPVAFAKELISLDDLADGRLTLGIGAGGEGWDATVLGHPAWSRRERGERFAEFLELTDLVLRQPETTSRGTYYSAHEARNHPGPVQLPRLPFAVAATGPQGMRLAAIHGQTWVTTGDRTRTGPIAAPAGAAMVAEQISRLNEACVAVGRDPGDLDRLVVMGPILDPGLTSVEEFRDGAGRYAEIGITDLVVHWPRPDGVFAGDARLFEHILESVL
jgi:alkanesulfonate monooxygenase SsuD/methylene tetrahydromethanopterin reductase-like flavin-dependent oxidoreductase (luciferase family)